MLQRCSNAVKKRRKHYINLMEHLVSEEFDRQYVHLPQDVQSRLERADVEAWALNRVPARYATGKRGMQLLEERLREMYGELLTQTVKQAFEVISKNSRPPGEACWPLDHLTE